MQLLREAYTLFVQGVKHMAQRDAIAELPHLFHDMILGARLQQKKPERLYCDLHAHLSRESPMTEIVDEAVKRVDVLAITEWNPDEPPPPHLDFATAVEKLDREELTYNRLGKNVVHVYATNGQSLFLLRGHETYAKENQGIVLVGTDKTFGFRAMTLDDTVRCAHDECVLWFLDHIAAVLAPGVGFRYPNREEMRMREGWIDRYRPPIETDNLQTTLHMYLATVIGRQLADKYCVSHMGNSDTHFGIPEMGQSRSSFPRELFDEKSVVESLRAAFAPERRNLVKVEGNYASLWNFFRYQVASRFA